MIEPRKETLPWSLLATLLLALFVDAANETRICDTLKGEAQCGENERCMQQRAGEQPYCDCLITYKKLNGRCVKEPSTLDVATVTSGSGTDVESGSGGSSVAAGLLIPTFLVALVAVLYFAGRRYKWLQRIRQYRQTRYGNVLVTRDEDDDDDPPISP